MIIAPIEAKLHPQLDILNPFALEILTCLTLRLLLFAQLLFSLKLVRLALLKAYYFRGFDFNPSSL